jgi:HEAT repeat protein
VQELQALRLEGYVRWLTYALLGGVVLGLLLGAGLLVQTYCVVREFATGQCTEDAALDQLGGHRAAARLGLCYRLHPPREIRPAVVKLLRRCGESGVPVLHRAVRDEDGRVREEAVNGLAANETDKELLCEVLSGILKGDPDPIVRQACVFGLEECGADAAPPLIGALLDRYEPIRDDAKAALGKLGPGAVPPLVAALGSRHPAQRRGAADALGSIRSAGEEVLSGLIRLLDDQDESVRVAAAEGLGRIGMRAIAARNKLMSLMSKDRGPLVRGCCARALGRIAPDDPLVLPELANRLVDTDPLVRRMAASTLGEMGATARRGNALANLTGCLYDRSPGVRAAAAVAIALIDPRRRAEMIAHLELDAAGTDLEERSLYAVEALEELRGARPERQE